MQGVPDPLNEMGRCHVILKPPATSTIGHRRILTEDKKKTMQLAGKKRNIDKTNAAVGDGGGNGDGDIGCDYNGDVEL